MYDQGGAHCGIRCLEYITKRKEMGLWQKTRIGELTEHMDGGFVVAVNLAHESGDKCILWVVFI
jgi:hypothetical protein